MSDDTDNIDVQATTEAEMLEALKAEIGENGFQRRLDAAHTATFVERGPQLLVTFETVERSLAESEDGLPLGMEFVEGKNWSLLHLSTNAPTWFRAAAVYELFDELVDVAFFEEFDRVLFYGSDMGGYAAAAFSVVAPGATVLTVSPQATMDRDRALWDDRFPAARRFEFADRYGYAPDMCEGADRAVVLYDPRQTLDCMHATLFHGSNVSRLKCRYFDSHIESSLREMGLLHQVIEMSAGGGLSPHAFYALLRRRKGHAPYLRNLLAHLDEQDSPLRMALFCCHALAHRQAPRFRRRLNAAKEQLAEAGKLPDWLADL